MQFSLFCVFIFHLTRAQCGLTIRAAAGTRVPDGYPGGNFLLPAATRVPEHTQITANVLNISAIFNRIYGIGISIYRILW